MSDGIKLLDCVQVLQLLVALSSFLTPLTAPYTLNEVLLKFLPGFVVLPNSLSFPHFNSLRNVGQCWPCTACTACKSPSRAHVRGCNGSDDPSGTLGITVAGSERP